MDGMNLLLMGTYFSVSMLLSIVALNSPQIYRPVLLVGIISFAVLSLRQISNTSFGFHSSEVLVMFILTWLTHMSSVLCVEKYVLPPKPGVTFDWAGAYNMLFNPRWIGTNRQSPFINVTAKREVVSNSKSEQRRQEYITDPSKKFRTMLRSPRTIFLRSRTLSLVATLITERLYKYVSLELAPQYGIEMDVTDFLPTKESYFRRLGEVTLRETGVRVWMVTFFIFYSFCLYNSIHDLLAILFVGTGFNNPEDWPFLFGDIRNATSLRNFWVKSWHSLVYRTYTSFGIWASKNIFGFPKSSFIGKLFINLSVFCISGAVHAIAIQQLGFVCGAWQELRFYVFNFIGMVLEMAAIAAFTKITRSYKLNSSVSKTTGYSWVFLFLFTVLPKSQFPKVFCDPST